MIRKNVGPEAPPLGNHRCKVWHRPNIKFSKWSGQEVTLSLQMVLSFVVSVPTDVTLQVSVWPLSLFPLSSPPTTWWSLAGRSTTCFTRSNHHFPGHRATAPGTLKQTAPVVSSAETAPTVSRLPASSSSSEKSLISIPSGCQHIVIWFLFYCPRVLFHIWLLNEEQFPPPFILFFCPPQPQTSQSNWRHWRCRWRSLGALWLPRPRLGHCVFLPLQRSQIHWQGENNHLLFGVNEVLLTASWGCLDSSTACCANALFLIEAPWVWQSGGFIIFVN